MKKGFGNYEYLAGRRGVTGSLWEGKDHFLLLQRVGFLLAMSEQYKRIDFDKIEAVTAAKTKRGLIWTIVYGSLLGVLILMTIPAVMSQNYGVACVFGSLILAVSLILFVHLRAGATWRMTIRTAVATHGVGAVGRRKDVDRVLGRIDALLEANEGEKDQRVLDDIVTAGMAPVYFQPTPVPMPTLAMQEEPELRPWRGRRMTWFAGALSALSGALMAGELGVDHILFTALLLLSGVAAFAYALIALVKVLKRAAPSGLMAVLITQTILLGVGGIMGYVVVLVASINGSSDDVAIEGGSTAFLQIISAINSDDLGNFSYAVLGVAVLTLLCGLVTMAILLKNPRSASVIPEANEEPERKEEDAS